MASSSRLSPSHVWRCFASLPEPRKRRGRIKHPLLNLVVIALCATIAGADDWQEIVAFGQTHRVWLGRFLNLSKGIPSHDTFERVFAAMDPVAFQKCLLAWMQRLHEVTKGQVIAIDGKLLREGMARSGEQGPMTLVSAWATQNHLLLGQIAAPKGSSELGALPKLLELLDLHGAIVTLDALGCQKEIVAQIVDQGGDYVIAVKGNQEKLEAAVQEALAEGFEQDAVMPTVVRKEQGHGRQECRTCTVLELPSNFPEREQWKGLRSVAMVLRDSVDGSGKKHTGIRYYISSLPAGATRILEAVRSHWSIENQLHWELDVAFDEDRNRARADHAQANLGIVRRLALSLLKNTEGLQGSMHCRRQQAAWSETTLEKVLFGSKEGQP